MNPITICTWCGLALDDPEIQSAGKICTVCNAGIIELNDLPFDELYTLPYGAITLNQDGIVTSYNQAEQNLSGKSAAEVIGKNFFAEVAPCTKVKEFAGRFAEFLTSEKQVETFDFTFPFPGWAIKVNIAFIKSPDNAPPHRITVLVKRSNDST